MQILQKVKTAALASVAAAALAGCNGTGISGDDIAIAPESLDGVTINFFDLFTLDFDSDFSGEGNEGGNVDYTRNQESAFLGVENDDGATGRETYIPATSSLSGLNYTWVRTARDAGTLTITFRNNEVYPSPDETLFADMFWGGPSAPFFASDGELVVDFLFTDQGGSTGLEGTTTAHIYYMYYSDGGGDGTSFWSTDVTFTLDGSYMPSGYNPYPTYDPDTPLDYVWEDLGGGNSTDGDEARTVIFDASTSGVYHRISFQSVGGIGPDVPGGSPADDTGTILIDVPDEGVQGASGTYAYVRDGGVDATLIVEFTGSGGGTVTRTFSMAFTNSEGGTYTDTGGGSGGFEDDLFTNTTL